MGGKSKSVDTSGLSAAAMAGQGALVGIGQQQMNFAQQEYARLQPLLDQIAQQQLGVQNQYMMQAQQQGLEFNNTFMPMIQDFANDARNFNTEGYREQLAQQAAADAALAFSTTQGATNRSMASMGINPNSGRFAAANRANDIQLAAQKANAMTGTRRQAEAEGQQRMMNAINMGSGLQGQSLQAAQMGIQAGSSAAGLMTAAGNQYLNGMNSAASNMQGGYGLGMNGMQSVLGIQQQQNAQKAQERGSIYSGIGTLVGAAATGGASLYGQGLLAAAMRGK